MYGSPSRPAITYLENMPRPKSILWVDDEAESLTSHVMFLEEQGFAVETTANGDDALVLLQRNQSVSSSRRAHAWAPRARGLRSIAHRQSSRRDVEEEEADTLATPSARDLRYLVKHAIRAISSVVTGCRGAALRSTVGAGLARGSRARGEPQRPGARVARRVESSSNLRSGMRRAGDEPAPDALAPPGEIREASRLPPENYASWLQDQQADRRLSRDIGEESCAGAGGTPCALVVVDCLRLDQGR